MGYPVITKTRDEISSIETSGRSDKSTSTDGRGVKRKIDRKAIIARFISMVSRRAAIRLQNPETVAKFLSTRGKHNKQVKDKHVASVEMHWDAYKGNKEGLKQAVQRATGCNESEFKWALSRYINRSIRPTANSKKNGASATPKPNNQPSRKHRGNSREFVGARS